MTRYVMEIDLGECESEAEAKVTGGRAINGQIAVSWRIRPASPSLPVIRTCGDCGWCGAVGLTNADACMHDGAPLSPTPPRLPRVDRSAAPPPWCPLLAGAP